MVTVIYIKTWVVTQFGAQLLHCTRFVGIHGYVGCICRKTIFGGARLFRENLGVLKIVLLWRNGNLGFWKPSDRIRACSRQFFFLENGNLGFWKPILGFWKHTDRIQAFSRMGVCLENGNPGFWKHSDRVRACSWLLCFHEMSTWDSGRPPKVHCVQTRLSLFQ